MTLLELQRQVNEAIAENERRGWSERNSMPVLTQINRATPTGRRKHRYIPLTQVFRGQMGVAGRAFGLTLSVEEDKEIKL